MFCQLIMAGLTLPGQQHRQLLKRKRIPRGLSYKHLFHWFLTTGKTPPQITTASACLAEEKSPDCTDKPELHFFCPSRNSCLGLGKVFNTFSSLKGAPRVIKSISHKGLQLNFLSNLLYCNQNNSLFQVTDFRTDFILLSLKCVTCKQCLLALYPLKNPKMPLGNGKFSPSI